MGLCLSHCFDFMCHSPHSDHCHSEPRPTSCDSTYCYDCEHAITPKCNSCAGEPAWSRANRQLQYNEEIYGKPPARPPPYNPAYIAEKQ